MRCDFFTIPAQDAATATEELNRLLSNARILSVDRQFVADGANSFWSVCVLSQTGGQRPVSQGRRAAVDYREVLSPEDFKVYARLRDLRKTLAQRDGVPPYSVFTNEQLAEIVRGQVASLSALKAINGVGDARVEKYGQDMLAALRPNGATGAHDL